MAIRTTVFPTGRDPPSSLYNREILQCILKIEYSTAEYYDVEMTHAYNITIDKLADGYDVGFQSDLVKTQDDLLKMPPGEFSKIAEFAGYMKWEWAPKYLRELRLSLSEAFLPLRNKLPRRSIKGLNWRNQPYSPYGPWEYLPNLDPYSFRETAKLQIPKSRLNEKSFLEQFMVLAHCLPRGPPQYPIAEIKHDSKNE